MEGREVYFIDLVYGDDDLGLLVESKAHFDGEGGKHFQVFFLI